MNNENPFDGMYAGGMFDGAGWYDEYGRPTHFNCRSVSKSVFIIDQDELDREGDRLVEFAKELLA